jgi:Na+/melibiose symporter-like transporter
MGRLEAHWASLSSIRKVGAIVCILLFLVCGSYIMYLRVSNTEPPWQAMLACQMVMLLMPVALGTAFARERIASRNAAEMRGARPGGRSDR